MRRFEIAYKRSLSSVYLVRHANVSPTSVVVGSMASYAQRCGREGKGREGGRVAACAVKKSAALRRGPRLGGRKSLN